MAIVRIPASLRTLTGGRDEVEGNGSTVGEVLSDLERTCPGMRERLLDDRGVRRFVNIYVGDESIRHSGGLATKVAAADAITIVPALAGG